MPETQRPILSVSQLNVLAKDILESSFPSILVEGEISNLAQPRSGHVYFSLKDEKSQIRVALFAGQKRRLNLDLEDGLKVIVKGNLSIFGGRGEFQLIAKTMEPSGEGELRRQFEALKNKLADKGWFDEQYKKPLPEFCGHLAVVTSPTGAAIRDILHVLNRRFPLMEISIIPSLVQGKEASKALCEAIEKTNDLKRSQDPRFRFELILLARGGGSLEDLWSFNEEAVAQAIFESELPIISGVGHETDYTISDWVADFRAPTPSAAAETLSEDQDNILAYLEQSLEDLICAIQQKISLEQNNLQHLSKRNKSPKQQLLEQQQRIDFLEHRLQQYLSNSLKDKQFELQELQGRLQIQSPRHTLSLIENQLNNLSGRLKHSVSQQNQKQQSSLANLASRLNNLSPLSTLERGYSITRLVNEKSGKVELLSDESKITAGQTLQTQLSQGTIQSTVTKIASNKDNSKELSK
jgi:exodeoxyribonuclease VII large subunit